MEICNSTLGAFCPSDFLMCLWNWQTTKTTLKSNLSFSSLSLTILMFFFFVVVVFLLQNASGPWNFNLCHHNYIIDTHLWCSYVPLGGSEEQTLILGLRQAINFSATWLICVWRSAHLLPMKEGGNTTVIFPFFNYASQAFLMCLAPTKSFKFIHPLQYC